MTTGTSKQATVLLNDDQLLTIFDALKAFEAGDWREITKMSTLKAIEQAFMSNARPLSR